MRPWAARNCSARSRSGMPPWHHPRLERNGHHVPMYSEVAAPPLACLWIRTGGSSAPILPDACSDLIWQAGRGAFVAGPDTGPVAMTRAPGAVFVGARFRPGAGGPALGLPLSELRDLRVDLAELDRELADRLPPDLQPSEALRRIAAIALTAPPPAPPAERGARPDRGDAPARAPRRHRDRRGRAAARAAAGAGRVARRRP